VSYRVKAINLTGVNAFTPFIAENAKDIKGDELFFDNCGSFTAPSLDRSTRLPRLEKTLAPSTLTMAASGKDDAFWKKLGERTG